MGLCRLPPDSRAIIKREHATIEFADHTQRFLYSYRLIYELTEHSVHVLAVLHGKRLLESVERFSR